MDSGIGLLAAAAALRALRPDADLVLSSDPDGMPWGPRTPEDVRERALGAARAAAEHAPDALVVACNTATVHALDAIRAELEPEIPVVGTVPAIKPAALTGGPVVIWATPATTGSAYQRGLIRDFAAGVRTAEVACPGLADAVDRADGEAIRAAVADAAARTPRGARALVLGCTHYELVEPEIRAALAARGGGSGSATAAPGRPAAFGDLVGAPDTAVAAAAAAGELAPSPALPVLHGSAGAVAAQALRRVAPAAAARQGSAGLVVLRSGRTGRLPAEALRYPAGRALTAARDPAPASVPAGR